LGPAAVSCLANGRTYRLAATAEPRGGRPAVQVLFAWVEDEFVKVEIPPMLR